MVITHTCQITGAAKPVIPLRAKGSSLATLVGLATACWMLFAVGTGWWWTSPVRADEIKLSGFWIGDVSVQGVEDGQVLYFNRVGTEFARSISSVQGLKLSAYPQLEMAYEAIAVGDNPTAQQALEQVRAKATPTWLRQWVSCILIDVYDRLDMPHEAVDLFLTLADEGAPAPYLSHVPAKSVALASQGIQDTLRQRITLSIENLAGRPEADMVKKLLEPLDASKDRIDGLLANDTPNEHLAADGDPSGHTSEEPTTTQAVTLASSLDVGDTITALLLQGQFELALNRVNQILEKDRHHLPMRLYQRGIAQLYIAQASDDNKRYHDAGLSFMSVLAYFPKSLYAGPSLVEAGVVHSKIGRADTAKKLYDKASFVIDAEEEPRYAARLEQLVENLNR